MTIQDALILADSHNADKKMSETVWALRVLAGAYRREKQISDNLKESLKDLDEVTKKV